MRPDGGYGITTSSEMITGLPAVKPPPAGAGPGEPPGPTGTATPAGADVGMPAGMGMPPSAMAAPWQESQPAAGWQAGWQGAP